MEGNTETIERGRAAGARVLIFSDNQGETLALQQELQGLIDRDGGELTVARSLEDARALLQSDEQDCIVLATSHLIGHEAIPAVLRHDDLVHRLPVVVVGDGSAWDVGRQALASGADDYVTRAELGGSRLVSSVLLAVERSRRRAADPPIRDALTGLPNRLLFMDRLRLAFARRERSLADVLVIAIDVSSFKEINDLLGHHAGDKVLVSVAHRLRSGFRAGDTVARLGGDKFAVCCEGPDLQSLLPRLTAKVDDAFREPIVIEGDDLAVTATTGFAFAHDDERDADLLLRRALAAVLEEKRRSERPHAPDDPDIDHLRA